MKSNYPIPRFIFALVIGAHATICYALFIKTTASPKKISSGSIQTRLVVVQPPKKINIQRKTQPKKHTRAAPVKAKKVVASPKKISNPILVKKEPVPHLPSRKTVKPTPEQKELKLPQEMKALALEQTSSEKKKFEGIKPNAPVQVYGEQLKSYLLSHIKLPRYGRALVQVTIYPDGSMGPYEILEWSDEEIMHTIKKKLAKITFPPFSAELNEKKEMSYVFELF